MIKKLQKLRNKLTEKQVKFVTLHKSGVERGKAYIDAGYTAKTLQQAQINASRLLTKNDKVIVYFEALKANDDRNTNISRTMQLNRLNALYDMAITQKNVPAANSVVREMNEMLGYHREAAPNLEKEQAKKAILETEERELEQLSKVRTVKLSEHRTHLQVEPRPRLGDKIG